MLQTRPAFVNWVPGDDGVQPAARLFWELQQVNVVSSELVRYFPLRYVEKPMALLYPDSTFNA